MTAKRRSKADTYTSAMTAASGFVTGLGGAVTLPITMLASIGGMYIISTRMSAAAPSALDQPGDP